MEKSSNNESSMNDHTMLSAGQTINTCFGWSGKIESIQEWNFRHGQGVTVRRLSDNKIFSIHPNDVSC